MSEDETVDFDSETGTLRIRDLTVSDPDVVDFFDERATEADVIQALRVGVISLEVAETSREVDYVEQAITELRHDFQTHVDDFVEVIEEQLEENTKFIEEELDPASDGTPTNRLKTDIEERIRKLRSTIDQEMGRQEEFQRSTHKGDDFEDQIGHLIQELAIGPFADVEHTGDYGGVLEDCKTGDYVISTEEGYRIVIEVKDWTSGLSKNKIKSELDEAIRNRESDCGLLVSRNASAVPETDIGWFHEFDPQRSVVVLSQSEEDEIRPSSWLSIKQ